MMRNGSAGRITGDRLYRATYCARTDPLPLLPSGPGGVGGVASRRTRHTSMISPGMGRDHCRPSAESLTIAVCNAEEKQQVPPLRYAPVGMTLLFGYGHSNPQQKCR